MSEKKRLIEVLMPLEQASILSPDEKYVSSGGYISTFHVWPARRPLAACRAALLATLLPDPGDAAARAELLDAIGGKITLDDEKSTDSEGNLVVEQKSRVKGGVLAWNAEDSPFMESLRQKIRDAHGGKAPQVFDPFSGGGAIPYEAMWLGSHSTASDLNPVAWLLLKGTLEYPQKYAGKKWPLPEFVNQWSDFLEDFHTGGKKRKAPSSHFTDAKQATLPTMFDGDLRWQMRAWGRWVLDKARADLAEHYPVVNGEPTVAYLWVRTCRDIQTGGRIPVLKTFMVCRKKGVRFALLPVVDEEKKAVTFKLLTEEHLSTPERRARVIEDHPFLAKWGVTAETLETFLKNGTRSDAGVWSPFSGGRPELLALNMKDIRDQGRRGLLGFQMTAVCVETTLPGKKKAVKSYRPPTAEELRLADVQVEEIDHLFADVPFGVIDEPTPQGGGRGASRAFSVQTYGLMKWRDLFTPRQLLAIGVFVKHTRDAIAQIRKVDPENAEALAVYLTIVFSKSVDYSSTQSRTSRLSQKCALSEAK